MKLPAILALACMGTVALAQQLPQSAESADPDLLIAPEEEVRRYSVEVIIFEFNDGATEAGEVFLPDEIPLPDEQPAEPLISEIELPDYRTQLRDYNEQLRALRDYENTPLEEIQLHGPVDVFLLQPEEYTLTDEYQRLQRLDAYKPLMHAGWVQTTAEPDIAPAIRLRRLGNPPLKLDGSLTLYLSRYLHLVVDLALHAEGLAPGAAIETTAEAEDVPYYGDSRYPDDGIGSVKAAAPQVHYRILEDRIFKNGDLRYFDHPKFGVLARIARYEMTETVLPGGTDEESLLPAPR